MDYSRKGLVQSVNKNRIYDYVAEHYTEMGSYDLKEVLLAVLGVCYDKCHGDTDEAMLMELIGNELESRDFGLEDDE